MCVHACIFVCVSTCVCMCACGDRVKSIRRKGERMEGGVIRARSVVTVSMKIDVEKESHLPCQHLISR